jgi:hypothetical protein
MDGLEKFSSSPNYALSSTIQIGLIASSLGSLARKLLPFADRFVKTQPITRSGLGTGAAKSSLEMLSICQN